MANIYTDIQGSRFTPNSTIINGIVKFNGKDFCVPMFTVNKRNMFSKIYADNADTLYTYFKEVNDILEDRNLDEVDEINNFLYFTNCNDRMELGNGLVITDRRMLLPYNLNLLSREDLRQGIDLIKVNAILQEYDLPTFLVDTDFGDTTLNGWKKLYDEYGIVVNKKLKSKLVKSSDEDDDDEDDEEQVKKVSSSSEDDIDSEDENLLENMTGSYEDESDIPFSGTYVELADELLPLCTQYFFENGLDYGSPNTALERVYNHIKENGLKNSRFGIIAKYYEALEKITELVTNELATYDIALSLSTPVKAGLIDTILEMEKVLTEVDLIEMYDICNLGLDLLYQEDVVEYKMRELKSKSDQLSQMLPNLEVDSLNYKVATAFINNTAYIDNLLTSMKAVKEDVERNFTYYVGYIADAYTPEFAIENGQMVIKPASGVDADEVGNKLDFNIISGSELNSMLLVEKAKLEFKDGRLEFESSKALLEELITQNTLSSIYDKIVKSPYRVPIISRAKNFKDFPATSVGNDVSGTVPLPYEKEAYTRLQEFITLYCNRCVDDIERTSGSNYSFEEVTRMLSEMDKVPKELIMYLSVLFYSFLLDNHFESKKLAKPPKYEYVDTTGTRRSIYFAEVNPKGDLVPIKNSLDYEATTIDNKSKINANKIYNYFTSLFKKDCTDIVDLIIEATRFGYFKPSVLKTNSGFEFSVDTMNEVGTDFLVDEERKEFLKQVEEKRREEKLKVVESIRNGEQVRCRIDNLAVVQCQPGNINDFYPGILYSATSGVNEYIPVYIKYYDYLEQEDKFSDIFSFARMDYTYELGDVSIDQISKRLFTTEDNGYYNSDALADSINPYLKYFNNPNFDLVEANNDFIQTLRDEKALAIKEQILAPRKVIPYRYDIFGMKLSALVIKLLLEADPNYNARLNTKMWFDNIIETIRKDDYYTIYELSDEDADWLRQYKSVFTEEGLQEQEPVKEENVVDVEEVKEEEPAPVVDVQEVNVEEQEPTPSINRVELEEKPVEEQVDEQPVQEEEEIVDLMEDMPQLEEEETVQQPINTEIKVDVEGKQETEEDYAVKEKAPSEELNIVMNSTVVDNVQKPVEQVVPVQEEVAQEDIEDKKNDFLNRANQAIKTQNAREKELLDRIATLGAEAKQRDEINNSKIAELENKNKILMNSMSNRNANTDLEKSFLQLKREIAVKDTLIKEKDLMIQSLKENNYEKMSNEELINNSLFVEPETNYNVRKELFKDEIVIRRNKVQVASIIRNNFSPNREIIGIFLLVIDKEISKDPLSYLMVGKNLNSYIHLDSNNQGVDRLRIKPCCGITSDNVDSEGYAFTILQNNPKVKRIRTSSTSSILNFYTRLEALLEEHFRDPSNEEVLKGLELVTTIGRDNLKAVAKDYKAQLDIIEKDYLLRMQEQ